MTGAWKSNMSRWCGHISTGPGKRSANFGSVRNTRSRGMTASGLRCDSVWCEVSIVPARSRINVAAWMGRAFSPRHRPHFHIWRVAPGWYRSGLRPSKDCANSSSHPNKKRRSATDNSRVSDSERGDIGTKKDAPGRKRKPGYSFRRAMIGSTLIARRAGIQHAANATSVSRIETAA
jgi:hypothetical protein